MDDLINNLDDLYGIIGDATDLFNETKMFFKDNDNPEAQNIINEINSFFNEGNFKFEEESEKKLQELRIELDKTNDRLKEIDSRIQEEEKTLEGYKELEETDEKLRLVTDSQNRLNQYREERKEILKTKESLETKIARLTELHKDMLNRIQNDKKYNIKHNVSKVFTEVLGEEDTELKATIISIEDKEIGEEEFDEIFDRFASALDKDMSYEKKSKLRSSIFPYVTNASKDREFTTEDLDKLRAIINGYKAEIVLDEELGSEEEERREVPLTPPARSREEGRAASRRPDARVPERTETVEPAVTDTRTSPVAGAADEEEPEDEMEPRELAGGQTIAVLMSTGVLPTIELEELEAICNQVHVDISEKGLNTVLDKEQLHRILFHKDIRELSLKDHLSKKTNEIVAQYDSMIAKYDELIARIEAASISFSPEFLEKVKGIRSRLVMGKAHYVSDSNRYIANVELQGHGIDRSSSKLNKKYSEYEKFKKKGNERKMNKIYKRIDQLRGKQVNLMSKQVRIANKNCDRFIEIANHQHDEFQRRQESVLAAAGQILEYKNEIDELVAANTETRDMLLDGFDSGLSRKEIRQANRDLKKNNRRIQALRRKQGRVDRKFQHTTFEERLDDFYSSYSR